MSSEGFPLDVWAFRQVPGGSSFMLIAVDEDGDEFPLGIVHGRDVAGHIVAVHNATLVER